MNKKILIISENFYPEEFKINELALAWIKMGYSVDVITQNPTYPFGVVFDGYKNNWYSKEVWNDINIYRVKTITGYRTNLLKKLFKYFTFMFFGSIVAIKIGKKYDHIFGFAVGALTSMTPASLINQIYKKPVTLWIQDIWPDSVYAYGFKKSIFLEKSLDFFVAYIYKHTVNFAISSNGFKTKIEKYLTTPKKILYSPNWADFLNQNLDKYSFGEGKVHFTFAGNIGTVQNLDNIILAFGSLSNKYIDQAQLNIVGDGSYIDTLKNIVIQNNIKNVVFYGRKPKEEIYKYLGASDFLILSLVDKPIFSLTVPAKTQTYIASKKPILAVINGEAADIVKNNNLGLIVDPNNIPKIKESFEKLIVLDAMIKKEYVKNCEKLSNGIFNKQVIIGNLTKLLY